MNIFFKKKKTKKTIVIVNSSNITGKLIYNEYKNLNKNLILLDKNPIKLEKTIKKEKKTSIYNIDNNLENISILKQLILNKYKKIDAIIFNNIEVFNATPIEKTSIKELTKNINNNIIDTIYLLKEMMILLKKSKNSSIIFTLFTKKIVNKAYMLYNSISYSSILSIIKTIKEEYSNHKNIKINIVDIYEPTINKIYS